MSNRALDYLINDPGGWPRGAASNEFQATLEKARLESVREVSGSPGRMVFSVVCLLGFLGFPFAYGADFAWRFHALWLIVVGFAVTAPAMRNLLLSGVPANTACAWPINRNNDSVRRYLDTAVKVTYVWLTSAAVFLQSALTMQHGLGADWNPFTRAIRITKGGPYTEYGFVEMIMFVSGFLAITGLVWWPMYMLFEWLETRKPNSEQGATANA